MPRAWNPGSEVGSGARERELPYDPAEWSRRLERAREARVKALAARKAEQDPRRLEEAPYLLVSRSEQSVPEAEQPKPKPPGRRVARSRVGAVAGLFVGVAAGAAMLTFLPRAALDQERMSEGAEGDVEASLRPRTAAGANAPVADQAAPGEDEPSEIAARRAEAAPADLRGLEAQR